MIIALSDAAHVHSPTGGQGLNSSVQDAVSDSICAVDCIELNKILNVVQPRMETLPRLEEPRFSLAS